VLDVDPECDDPVASPSPSSTPDAGPNAWHRTGQYRYRWLEDQEFEGADGETYTSAVPTLQVIADNGCAHGYAHTLSTMKARRSMDPTMDESERVAGYPSTSMESTPSIYTPDWVKLVDLRCARTPWTRTYRGRGSDDRFVTIPTNESIRGRFTVRAPTRFGCSTAVYVDGESVDAFDLFFDGRQTKARSGWIDAAGKTHLKVISSCPWTLTFTGYR